jgi:hypothetical protein
MLKLQVRRWSERPRILVLMLAVILPAAALIVSGVVYLCGIQRDKAIEATFQREYQHVLAIAESGSTSAFTMPQRSPGPAFRM